MCQTLPPPSLVKAVNKLSIQGCTKRNGAVITWKEFLNYRKSSSNVTNISWYHLFNSLLPKDLWCPHTFLYPLCFLASPTHSHVIYNPWPTAAQIPSSLAFPCKFQSHQISCFLLCWEMTGVKRKGRSQGRKWLYK